MEEYIYKEECYKIIGACMEVHKELGSGFLEGIYQESLSIELETSLIPFSKEAKLDVLYKDIHLSKHYFADFICYEDIIVETKAVSELSKQHIGQVLNYLKATNSKIGLLVNFGSEKLQHKRIIR
jgi:GxxExxY protein